MLPQKTRGTYREFDVTNGRDSPRFVRDTQTGDVYYTKDHYENFIHITPK
ncbi:ribonuclease domain-containing protein [Helicobacter cinaedi]|nr:ribonuclease domain-containing protein [Helicobacter cinaedi]